MSESPFRRGQTMSWHNGMVRIMAVAEGYLMVRYWGCHPFLITEKEARQFEAERMEKLRLLVEAHKEELAELE